jgi:bacillithiol system protein YtxJ
MEAGLVVLAVVALMWGMRAMRLRSADRLEVGETRFVPVADLAALDDLLAPEREGPTLLFLHDPGCPVSAAAHRRVARLGGEVPLVDVCRQKDLSRAIEARTGVRHESPQALVLRGGRAVWSASHRAVTAEAIAAACASNPADPTRDDPRAHGEAGVHGR